ncbi:MAG: zinc ribbon domain-containing protein [Candidatus Hydrogenedentes bacterium]|nr:zinc ribbon domain-containing protein [Candidatus Hydrogenedentota bacterium]MBI3118780.1 zinc ribbon domain-containing protein [Candidatus Hydrogenedentota bacterium]
MPTYSYECKKCGNAFEVFHGMNEAPRVKCGECGGLSRKLIGTGAGIIFKGSGFYETDYKKKPGGPGKDSKEPKAESSAGNGKSTSDTTAKKPEKAAPAAN